MSDVFALVVGLATGLLAGAVLTALAFRIAIDELVRQAFEKLKREAAERETESRGYENPYADLPRRG